MIFSIVSVISFFVAVFGVKMYDLIMFEREVRDELNKFL